MKVPKKPTLTVVVSEEEYRQLRTWAAWMDRDMNDLLEEFLPQVMGRVQRDLLKLLGIGASETDDTSETEDA